MPRVYFALSIIFFAALFSSAAFADTKYVGNGGNDNATGRSFDQRWEKISFAVQNINAGDTLIITNGSYDFRDEGDADGIIRVTTPGGGGQPYDSINGRVDGGVTNYTTIKAQNPKSVFIRGNLHFAGSYINVEGLRMHGSFPDGSGGYDFNNSPGLFFMDSHHINVYDCEIGYCGGGGINFNHSDCINVYRNEVYSCCRLNPDQHSAISVFQPIEVEDATVTGDPENRYWRIQIKQNICYLNRNSTPSASGAITDGNGIILDDYKYIQRQFLGGRKPSADEYEHRTLVEGNLCNYNGGSGIQVFYAKTVTVKNNTCIGNRQFTYGADGNFINLGQVSITASKNCHVLNNVLVSKYVSGAPGNSPFTATNLGPEAFSNFWERNLIFSTVTTELWRMRNGPQITFQSYKRDPLFVDETAFDYTSVAGRNRGIRWSRHEYFDNDGTRVAPNSRVDLGAFQN